MPPFQSSRRFDPYDDPLPNTTPTHHATTIRQQRHPHTATRSPPHRTDSGNASTPFHPSYQPAPQHQFMPRPPPYGMEKQHRLNAIGRILADDTNDDFDRDARQTRRNPHDLRDNNLPSFDNSDRRHILSGAANLGTQIHPLLSSSRQQQRRPAQEYYKDKPLRHRYEPDPNEQSLGSLLAQARRILALLLGHLHREDYDDKLPPRSEEEILIRLLSSKSAVRTLRLFLLLPLLFYASKRYLPPLADGITRPAPWKWSAGVSLPGTPSRSRNLAGRNCVMNYFIEKQPKDEYDPDFEEVKPGEAPKPVAVVEGTYRTKGQIHVISRFIEAVADSFRSNTAIRQHLIFAETRDSGHLAYEATRHWPPRGKHRTMVHVIASEESADTNDFAARALGYGSLEDIEERFRGMDKARIYDREGNLAGLADEEGVDDDETLKEMMEMEVPDGETVELRMRSAKRQLAKSVNSTVLSDGSTYPNLRAMLPFEEEDDEGEIVVPYLHVDGVSMAHQLRVLEAARSLLLDKTVVVVGIEHSPDMNARELIAFFKGVEYKTFFLGARQVARIDNLCEEVLDDVLDHPSVSPPDASPLRRLFMNLGLVSKDELRIAPKTPVKLAGSKRRETPPFFVAMPRGRKSKEEMTIQHMYDLFGGYGGGGGQIATANDRKAPGKS